MFTISSSKKVLLIISSLALFMNFSSASAASTNFVDTGMKSQVQAMTADNSHIYAGGTDSSGHPFVSSYDPTTNTWTDITSNLSAALPNLNITALAYANSPFNHEPPALYVAGNSSNQAYVYEYLNGAWVNEDPQNQINDSSGQPSFFQITSLISLPNSPTQSGYELYGEGAIVSSSCNNIPVDQTALVGTPGSQLWQVDFFDTIGIINATTVLNDGSFLIVGQNANTDDEFCSFSWNGQFAYTIYQGEGVFINNGLDTNAPAFLKALQTYNNPQDKQAELYTGGMNSKGAASVYIYQPGSSPSNSSWKDISTGLPQNNNSTVETFAVLYGVLYAAGGDNKGDAFVYQFNGIPTAPQWKNISNTDIPSQYQTTSLMTLNSTLYAGGDSPTGAAPFPGFVYSYTPATK